MIFISSRHSVPRDFLHALSIEHDEASGRKFVSLRVLTLLLLCVLIVSLIANGIVLFRYAELDEKYHELEKAYTDLNNTYHSIINQSSFVLYQASFPPTGDMLNVTYPDYPRIGRYLLNFDWPRPTTYVLPIRYDLFSLHMQAKEVGYYSSIDLQSDVSGTGSYSLDYYNNEHGANIPNIIGFVEHHLGYDLVVGEESRLNILQAVLKVEYKLAEDAKYIVKLDNSTNIQLKQEGRSDLSDQDLQEVFSSMLDKLGIISNWIPEAKFSENIVFHLDD